MTLQGLSHGVRKDSTAEMTPLNIGEKECHRPRGDLNHPTPPPPVSPNITVAMRTHRCSISHGTTPILRPRADQLRYQPGWTRRWAVHPDIPA